MEHTKISASTIDALINAVSDAHTILMGCFYARDYDTDEMHISFVMARPVMEGVVRVTREYRRSAFIIAAQDAAHDLASDTELADFANACLSGTITASDDIPARFIDEVAARVFGID